MLRKVFKVTSVLLGIYFQGFTQNAPGGLKVSFAPASPEAALLFKFEDIPVSKYTGTADVNIPLVNVQAKTTGFPISLSYHSGGNKVEDVASYVGLGWKLNVGGMISRKVHGLPDDGPRGKLTQGNWRDYIYTPATPNMPHSWNVMLGLIGDRYDGETDEFYFSFNGYSGKMAFRDTSSANPGEPLVVSSNVPLKVSYTFGNGGINQWQITTPDGMQYTFASIEKTRIEITPYVIDQCNPFVTPNSEYASSWYLTSINSVNGFNEGAVNFTYDDYNTDYEIVQTETETHTAWSGSDCILEFPNSTAHLVKTYSKSRTFIKGKKIKQIAIADSKLFVDFIYQNKRLDLPSTINDMSLDAIVVSRDTSSTGGRKRIEKVVLKYFYQGNRLMLQSVQKVANDESMPVPPYQFTYNPQQLPDRVDGIKNTDHWGYYNYGNLLLPSYEELIVPGWNYYDLAGTAKKSPDFLRTKAQILEKVIYPTGGSTELEYEPNSYSFVQDEPLGSKNIYNFRDTNHFISVVGQNNGYTNVTKEFTLSESGRVTISFSGGYAPCFVNPESGATFCGGGNLPKVALYKLNSSQNTFELVYAGSITIDASSGEIIKTLDPGIYKMEASAKKRAIQAPPGNIPDSIGMTVVYRKKTDKVFEKVMGGLRVKQVRDYDSIGKIAKVRRFDYSMDYGGQRLTSGVIYAEPKYLYDSYPIHTDPVSGLDGPCLSRTIVGSSTVVLDQTQGSPIGYQQVTDWEEYLGEPNGKIVTNYTSPRIYSDIINDKKPYGTPESYSYKTGLVQNEKYYSKAGLVVKEDSFEYFFKHEALLSVKVSKGLVECPCPNPNFQTICREGMFLDIDHDGLNDFFSVSKNNIIIGFSQLKREIHMQDGFTIEKSYQYDNNLLLVKRVVVKNNSADGDSVSVSYKYPGDEGTMQGLSAEELQAIATMKSIGMTATVLEEQKQRQNSNTLLIRNHYKNYDNIAQSKPAMSGLSIQNASSSLERKYYFDQYDNFGNVKQQHKINDFPYSYIWDDFTAAPVAEVSNATQNNIAFTSFESGISQNSGWTTGPSDTYNRVSSSALTGKYSYELSNGSISKSGLTAGNRYIVSYWSKSGPYNVNGINAVAGKSNSLGWTYYEHLTNVNTTSVAVTGSGLIDELRLYPENAEMVTYTYEPGVGILSKNSIDNIISFYEYDVMNRFKSLRDQDGNILQLIEYQYLKQERNVAASWIDVSPMIIRCETGMDIGGANNYNTGYMVKKQIDTNAYSPSYNQIRWIRQAVNNACPISPDWQYYSFDCVYDDCGNITGQYRNVEKDRNPYSNTYNQTRITAIVGSNTTFCPVTANCTTEGYKKINNVCVLGQKVVTQTYNDNCYRVTVYHYEWSCGPQSGQYSTSVRIPGCTINQ